MPLDTSGEYERPTEDDIVCIAGHPLVICNSSSEEIYEHGWQCDRCNDDSHGVRFVCQQCKYDCCIICYLDLKDKSFSSIYTYNYFDRNLHSSKGNHIIKRIHDFLDVVRCDRYKNAFIEAQLDENSLLKLFDDTNIDVLNSFILEKIGVEDKIHKNMLKTMLYNLHNKMCLHTCIEKWDDEYVCIECFNYLNCDKYSNNLRDDVREKHEREIENTFTNTLLDYIPTALNEEERKDYIGKLSQHRGVPINWLIDFTNKNKCWHMSTQEVCRRFVYSATASRRCRYVELDHMQGITGPASTFISHCRGGTWGDLVAAICDGGADRDRRVWIDIFACRQWPSARPDLDFDLTIRKCSSFLVVCSSLKEVEDFDWDKVHTHKSNMLPKHVKSQIPFIRVWCLVEIYTASMCKDLPIIMKGGSCRERAGEESTFVFKHNYRMLDKLSFLIDIKNAEATIPQDKEMILKMIRGVDGDGIEKLNSKVRGTMKSIRNSSIDNNAGMLQNAACGDNRCVLLVKENPMYYLEYICNGGYVNLLKDCILNDNKHTLFESKDKLANAMTKACAGGHTEIVKLLLDCNADINMESIRIGWTPLMSACSHGFLDTVKLLIANNAKIDIKGRNGWTSLMFACKGGHEKIVDLLIENGADINLKNDSGFSSVMKACEKGHTLIVKRLLECGADVSTKNEIGETLLMEASRDGFVDIVKLFIEYGVDRFEADHEGRTALDHAREGNYDNCIKYLTELNIK